MRPSAGSTLISHGTPAAAADVPAKVPAQSPRGRESTYWNLLTALTYYFEQNSNHELNEMNTQQLFDLVLSQASEHAILLLDPQGSIIEWSAGAARLFGHKRDL